MVCDSFFILVQYLLFLRILIVFLFSAGYSTSSIRYPCCSCAERSICRSKIVEINDNKLLGRSVVHVSYTTAVLSCAPEGRPLFLGSAAQPSSWSSSLSLSSRVFLRRLNACPSFVFNLFQTPVMFLPVQYAKYSIP